MTTADASYKVGMFLTNLSYSLAKRKRSKALEGNKGKLLAIVSKFLCELAGWGCFVYAAFLLSSVAGFVVGGIAFLVLSWRIETRESSTNVNPPQYDPTLRGR